MNIIELRDRLNALINAEYGKKKAAIAQVTRLDYDMVYGFDITDDLTTVLICTWDKELK